MKILSVIVAMGVLGVGATALAEEKAGAPKLKTDAVKTAPAAPAATAAVKTEPVKAEAVKTEPVKPAPTPEAVKSAPAASGGLTVEAKLCKNLQNREPVDITDTFKIADGQVVTFSRVTGGAGSEIHHVYFLGDKQLDDIKLKVTTSPFRTNSRKTLRADAGMAGDWRVEVRDASGAVLETLKFKVE